MAQVTGTDARSPLVARITMAVAGCVLLVLGAAYYLTYEPAPRIGILWRAGMTPERRAALERRFLLVHPLPERDRLAYDLLDTSRLNIEALVHERDVADTDRVSRERFEVPFDIPYGASWMWVAHRTPVLRTPGVVPAIVLTCMLVLAAGIVSERSRMQKRRRDRIQPGVM